MNNYLRNPRFYHQSEQDSESALVSRNTNETGKRLGGMDEHPIILDLEKEKTLTTAMRRLHEFLLPTNESHEKRKLLADKVKKILNDEFPDRDIEVHMFGSSMNELGTTHSDVDLCVTTQWHGLKNIHILSDCLKKHMKVEQIVSKAKVPIVRLFDQKLDLACDINVNNTLALDNTRLIRKYVSIDPRVQPLAMIVKYWARRRVLNDAAKGGTISTYTWTCIILNFLQMRDPPILPVLHQIPHKGIPPIMVNGEDASFYEDVESLSQFGSKNKETIGGLLFAFFRRMAFEFNYDEHVISLRQGKYLTKADKGWDTCKGWKMLCVEEPFNTARNLGNSADDVSVNGLIEEFRRAYDILYESACLDKLCEQYHFPPNHNINNNHYYSPSRYRQPFKRNNNKPNVMWKQNRKNYTKFHQQNGQNNCLNNTTDNLHYMNGKSNDPQGDEEDGSSMRRFDSVSSLRQNSHYNGSEGSTPNGYYYYENNDSSTRKQFDSRRYNHHYNVPKDDEQLRSQSKQKNNSYIMKKRNDDQSHNYGQSQDSEHEGFVRYLDSIPNQNQPKNIPLNKKGSAARLQSFPFSDQKHYSQNTITFYDPENNNKYNNNNGYSRHPNIDSGQKSFVTYSSHDSEKRPYNKPYLNKHGQNSKQVEEPITDDLSNPISSSKSINKSNNNKYRGNKHTQSPRQHQKPTGNVDFNNNNNYSCNNDKVDDSFSSNSIPPSNSGSGNLNTIYHQQLYHRQSNDGSTNSYQRRMSHQSSSDGSNSQTSGNTSNTSNTSYSSSCTKNNYQKTNSNQNNYQQNNQNKSNNNNSSKKRKCLNNNNTNGYNNSVNGHFRMNNTMNNPSMTMTLSCNDSNLQDVAFIPPHINQGQGGQGQYGNDYNLNSNGSFKSYNNNSNSSNGWKGSYGHYYAKTNGNSNTNNGMKLANGGNNSSNRNVNSNNSNNNLLRSNCNNHNINNHMKNQNNNNNNANSLKSITGNNYKPFDGNNNSNMQQARNFNNNHSNPKNGGNFNKKRSNKYRSGVKAENKEDGVNYQQQYSQEGSVQERQNKKVGQNGQSNNSGKGKCLKKYPSCPKQIVGFQQQQ